MEENNEQTKLIKERIYALSSLLWVSLCKTICLTFQNVFVKSQIIVLHVRLDKISSMNTRYALGQKAFTVWYNDLCLRLRRCHKLWCEKLVAVSVDERIYYVLKLSIAVAFVSRYE